MSGAKNRDDGGERKDRNQPSPFYLRIIGLLLLAGALWAHATWAPGTPRLGRLDGQAIDDGGWSGRSEDERREFLSYAWGIGLALVLTVVPFALIHWLPGLPRLPLFVVIGAFALLQMLVHFHFFLHIGFRQRREDLQLLLFSALLLTIMVGGTIWIMASLALRMSLPGSS